MSNYPTAHINLDALKHNLTRVKTLAPNSQVMSVIKANGYGHGILQIAHALSDSDAFAVARVSEGIQLREAGIDQPIVILKGIACAEDIQAAAKYSLSPVFHHPSQIALINTTAVTTPLPFCWLMVETGMARLGIVVEDVATALAALNKSPAISGQVGLMSHFANADLPDDPRNQQQLMRLIQSAEHHDLPMSMANSGAILSYPASHGDWVRPGLMLYGISPFSDQSASDLGLKPVMTLTSSVIAIQRVNKGEQVGYGGDWIANKQTQIGIVGIGYGDGYSRQLSNVGMVMIDDKCVPVLGRVSMDMICIDLSDIPNAEIGDKVVLWGDKHLSVEQVAQQASTIPYELVCQISDRVPRQYHG